MTQAIHNMKCGKAPGPDNIHLEFINNLGPSGLKWLAVFFSTCMRLDLLPKIWRKANIIAILKSGKDAKVPKSYRPISLLCVQLKILERVVLSRIAPYVEKCLPDFQAGFRAGRSTIDQVLQLCSIIEDGFQLKQKTAVALVDLTAAYDTVWHQGLQLKLLRTIRDKHLVAFTMETLSNRRFVLRSGVRRKFEWGVSFTGVWCQLYLVCVVCDVIFMFFKPTFWRSLRWSAIADKIKTIVSDKVNYRGTQSKYAQWAKGLQKVVRWFLDADDNPDSNQNLIITFWPIYNVP